MSPSSAVRQSAAFGFGVWGALTVWAALAQYLLPGRGSALGKLGSFHWVFLINLVPALLCASGFVVGRALMRLREPSRMSGWRVALLLGMLFPLTLGLLRPVFAMLGHGLMPALVWCVAGSAIAGAVFGNAGYRSVDANRK